MAAAYEPKIGDVFEDRDYRMHGRRVVIVSEFQKPDQWNNHYPAFSVRTIEAPNAPTTVGNVSSLAQHSLLKRYRLVTTETAAPAAEESK